RRHDCRRRRSVSKRCTARTDLGAAVRSIDSAASIRCAAEKKSRHYFAGLALVSGRPQRAFFQGPSLSHRRQASLSCAPCCAALSLKNNSNQRICGSPTPQEKAPPMTGILQNYLPLVVFI